MPLLGLQLLDSDIFLLRLSLSFIFLLLQLHVVTNVFLLDGLVLFSHLVDLGIRLLKTDGAPLCLSSQRQNLLSDSGTRTISFSSSEIRSLICSMVNMYFQDSEHSYCALSSEHACWQCWFHSREKLEQRVEKTAGQVG